MKLDGNSNKFKCQKTPDHKFILYVYNPLLRRIVITDKGTQGLSVELFFTKKSTQTIKNKEIPLAESAYETISNTLTVKVSERNFGIRNKDTSECSFYIADNKENVVWEKSITQLQNEFMISQSEKIERLAQKIYALRQEI